MKRIVITQCSVSFVIDWGVRQLVDCGVRRSKLDYELIVEYLFGKKGYYTVTVFMFLFAYGAMIAYHIVIGDGLYFPITISIHLIRHDAYHVNVMLISGNAGDGIFQRKGR